LDNETSKIVKCHEFGLSSATRADRADAYCSCFSPSSAAKPVNALTPQAGAYPIRVWSALSRAFRIMRMAIVARPLTRFLPGFLMAGRLPGEPLSSYYIE